MKIMLTIFFVVVSIMVIRVTKVLHTKDCKISNSASKYWHTEIAGTEYIGYVCTCDYFNQENREKELLDRIDKAIAVFVEEYGSIQHYISLPEKEFQEFKDYANGTELGRSFTQYGLAYCTLPVTVNTGAEILICPEIVWE